MSYYISTPDYYNEYIAHYGVKGMKWHIRRAKGKALELRAKGLRRLHGIKDASDVSLDITKKRKGWGLKGEKDDGRNRSTSRPTGNLYKTSAFGYVNNGYSKKSIQSNFEDRTGHSPGLTRDITNSNYKNGKYKKKKKK